MILAQVEQVTTSGLSDFAGKFGFPALLVLVLLYGIYQMQKAATAEREKREADAKTERKERDDRDEKREEARRTEREKDRQAHVDALAAHTATLNTLGQAIVETGRKVDNLVSRTDECRLRIAKGG